MDIADVKSTNDLELTVEKKKGAEISFSRKGWFSYFVKIVRDTSGIIIRGFFFGADNTPFAGSDGKFFAGKDQ